MTIHDLTLGLLLGLPWALVGVINLGSAAVAVRRFLAPVPRRVPSPGGREKWRGGQAMPEGTAGKGVRAVVADRRPREA